MLNILKVWTGSHIYLFFPLSFRFSHSIHSVYVFLRADGDGPSGLNPPAIMKELLHQLSVCLRHGQACDPGCVLLSGISEGLIEDDGFLIVFLELISQVLDLILKLFISCFYLRCFGN